MHNPSLMTLLRGQLKCWLLGGSFCLLVCAFHPMAINRKQFSSSEELLQTSRGVRGLRDLPVHRDSCQEQWQQWEGQWRNFASDFSRASPHCLDIDGPEPDNSKHWYLWGRHLYLHSPAVPITTAVAGLRGGKSCSPKPKQTNLVSQHTHHSLLFIGCISLKCKSKSSSDDFPVLTFLQEEDRKLKKEN